MQQHQRAVLRRVLGELHSGLEQAGAREVGRDVAWRGGGAAEPARQRGREPPELLRPFGGGRRRVELAREAREQLGPGTERRRSPAEVHRGGAGGARGVGVGEEVGGETRLADPALAAEQRDRAGTRAGALPDGEQSGLLGGAAHERRVPCERVPRERGRGRHARLGGAHARGQRAGLGGRGEAEVRAQAVGDAVVGGQRRRTIAGLDQAAASGRAPPPRRAGRAPAGGARSRPPRRDRAPPPRAARAPRRAVRPVRRGPRAPSPRRDRPAADRGAERNRVVEPPGGAVRVELGDVGRATQTDAVASTDQRVVCAERAAQRPGGAAQRSAGARVKDIGPEARRDRAARMLAGVQREPAEQRPRAATRGRHDGTAVDIGLQLPEEPHMQHRATLHPR